MKAILFPNNGSLPDKPVDQVRVTIFGSSKEEAMGHAYSIVPPGVPFLLVDQSDVPTDRTYRDAWRADFSNPDGIGGQP